MRPAMHYLLYFFLHINQSACVFSPSPSRTLVMTMHCCSFFLFFHPPSPHPPSQAAAVTRLPCETLDFTQREVAAPHSLHRACGRLTKLTLCMHSGWTQLSLGTSEGCKGLLSFPSEENSSRKPQDSFLFYLSNQCQMMKPS